jgi:hypothetical protein
MTRNPVGTRAELGAKTMPKKRLAASAPGPGQQQGRRQRDEDGAGHRG